MREVFQSGGGWRQLRRRDWLCLLLVITFLYNPFLAASSSFRGQSVSHLPSFRATAASSELLKFKPKEKFEVLNAPECDVAKLFGFAVVQAAPAPISRNKESGGRIPPPIFLDESLWFRPPPVVG